MEKATLNTPDAVVVVTDFRIGWLTLRRWPAWRLEIGYLSNTDETRTLTLEGDDARVVITALNTANLSVKSLERRALEYLQAHGLIPASAITGSPD